jgi:hypothetical protein
MYMHRLYDLVVASVRRLPAPLTTARQANLTIAEHAQRRTPEQPANQYGYTYARLSDGSIHVSWSGLFDFIVSADGRRIDVHAENTWHHEPVYTYLLSQVVSVALLRHDVESLHGSAVAIEENGVVILGNCGYGKSTLCAALVHAGAKLLTDDLVVIRQNNSAFDVAPGAFRLKLDPATAASLALDWPSVPMEDGSGKHVYQVTPASCSAVRVPLRSFVLLQPSNRLEIETVTRGQAVRELLRATFNPLHTDASRLEQLLLAARALADRVPMIRLYVPRSLGDLDEVTRALFMLHAQCGQTE